MAEATSRAVDPAEVTALRAIAGIGFEAGDRRLDEPVKLSCATLGDRLGTSSQTASRRLRRLEEVGLLTRDAVADGQWVTLTEDGLRVLRHEYERYRRLFDGPPIVELVGRVTGGMGEGRHYITLDGYMRQFRDRLGYEPYPGTLNVALTDESVRRRGALEGTESVPIDGWSDDDRTYGPATCYPAVVEAEAGAVVERAHVIEPVRTHHDDAQLEVIAPVRLRDELDLADGDRLLVRTGDLT
ncbi:MAG: DUF120 domain-containing protein [Halobacteriales archaeon]